MSHYHKYAFKKGFPKRGKQECPIKKNIKNTLFDLSFREIKHKTVLYMKLIFNKRSDAVHGHAFEGLGAAVVAALVRTSLSPVVFQISPFMLFFSEVLASVMILGRNSLLKLV